MEVRDFCVHFPASNIKSVVIKKKRHYFLPDPRNKSGNGKD